ncbi:MAG: UvrB/UvrC motif-containing protein [Pyrinomonadaceae bacterium]
MIKEIQFSIASAAVYPHIKLTNERFPRALATRILKDDGDEYFGAFLNRTSVRILIDFLNRTFRLRTCTIAIDGSFPVPCTQYYAKRCVAPCVASLCDEDSYAELVGFVRLFLRNERELFLAAITKKIERAASDLDFETAAYFRDMLQKVENFWSNARWRVWLDDTVDTFELIENDGIISVIIISQRRSRTLGEIVYSFAMQAKTPSTQVLADLIAQFYRFHLPREIRVSKDFDGRTVLAKELGKKFGRKLNIVLATGASPRVTTARALDRTRDRLELEAKSDKPDAAAIKRSLAQIFALDVPPSRIEVFDAAHISATGFAAGVSVWKDGYEIHDEYAHWVSDRESELETLRAFVADRVPRTAPDLIVIDGGLPQLNAALAAINDLDQPPRAIAAVKPKGKHTSISHFLTDDGRRIEFDRDAAAFHLLQRLRDDAHALANSTHRLGRDMMHFYELAAMAPSLNERERQELLREAGSLRAIADLDREFYVKRFGAKKGKDIVTAIAAFRSGDVSPKPLIVPISFVELAGSADDLIPIDTRH